MTLRKILFWVHLTAGSIAGVVILIMSLTGVSLAYERQVIAWVDRAYRSDPPQPGAPRLPVGTVLAKVCATQPSTPSSITLHSNPASPVEVGFGRERTVYFNPYTGDAVGVGSQRTRSFFQTAESWHRWLGASAANRSLGRSVTGICNLAFLVLVSTGLFLWWPKSWSLQRIKAAITWRWDRPAGRARGWNWHTVTGFWCAAPLLVIVSCGVVMSFPWANNLLYRMMGNDPPPVQGAPAATAPVAASRTQQGERSEVGRPGEGQGLRERRKGNRIPGDANASGVAPIHADGACSGWDFDRAGSLWDRAESQVPGWQTISLRTSANLKAPAVFSIDQGNGGRPDKRSQLSLDWQTGDVVRWETFSSYNAGRRLRAWVRFSHTGEAGGLLGQTVAALATAGTVVLVFTGLTMAWMRFLERWVFVPRRRRESRSELLSPSAKI